MIRSGLFPAALAVCLSLTTISITLADDQSGAPRKSRFEYITPGQSPAENFVCGTTRGQVYLDALNEAIAAGEIPDPRLKIQSQGSPPALGTLYRDTTSGHGIDLYLYPDGGLLTTNFSDGALFNLMTAGANELITQHGDQFDFVAFWLNFGAHHQIGAAFYLGLENDVTGIGEGTYNFRPSYGLQGVNTEGYVMMWNVNDWEPGTFGFSDGTRLVLGQEFEHRWGMFLNDIQIDGTFRPLQGNDGACGRSAHWNFDVDGQGSGMEIREWVGLDTLYRIGGTLNFNTDIGGVFSYADLYLMGYVSAAEMDAGNSEFRYLTNNPSCATPYAQFAENFSSAEIIAGNGLRLPTPTTSQKHYKTGWVMFYQGALPNQTAIDRAINIMKQHELDWKFGVLDRGTMDNSIDEGHFSTTGIRVGQGPQTLQFTYDTTFTASAWDWDFGDGASSTVQDPGHSFAPGVYDVELAITTPHDVRTTTKREHVVLWADTMGTPDLTVPEDTGSFYWEVSGVNKVPLKDIVIPITLTNVPGTVTLDSASTIGCRTNYFEYKQIVFDNRPNGQMAYRMRADNGGGTVPLAPGSGPVLRIWMHTNVNTDPGETVDITVGQLGLQTYKTITVGSVTFTPQFAGGTITMDEVDCPCPCHGDPVCDGVVDVLDVVSVTNEAFRGAAATTDPGCPHASRRDVDCDCSVGIIDVIKFIEVAFRGGNQATVFCSACLVPCL